MIKKDKYPVSSSLFGVAAIQAVVGFLGWSIHSPNFTPIDWVLTFSFAIFAVLAVIARWTRVPAAITAIAIYGAFLLLQASISLDLLVAGLIFKIPIIILLFVGLIFAFKPKGQTQQDKEFCQQENA